MSQAQGRSRKPSEILPSPLRRARIKPAWWAEQRTSNCHIKNKKQGPRRRWRPTLPPQTPICPPGERGDS
eukprot:7639145-Karenia_brevis.AAC.1